MAAPNPFDYEAIRNCIARYSIAPDTKNFALFKEVFAEDVQAQYSFWGCQWAYEEPTRTGSRLAPVQTQHSLTTQTIEIDETGQSAVATTYFAGLHFGVGKWKGQQVSSWGKYDDHIVLVPGRKDIPGSSGKWLIQKRTLTFMGRWGEEGVMQEEQ
ncbi:uncharacterized protein E0L32_010770 [Thyridium curvatum]|uniref:SnoaL-like domain-containing protein n=1 Tax=Thyridium curvatum TaxID=1093900 RepID=A0A507AJ20_9PEZI|nr:uncharacterized protein E0L32_010770 [Thyridium curvatum]TPX07273.1 hypothetical protein E0L32_010770 [Thyridium curvatum]